MVIRFLKRVERTTILNPKRGFRKEVKLIEVRRDPLTGRVCRISVERTKRPFHEIKVEELVKLTESSRKSCPFCPENIEVMTPKFPTEIVEGGRIRIGEFTLFPNLYPFANSHAIGVLTRSHFLPLNKLSPRIWVNCVKGSVEFFKRINDYNKKLRFPSINLNYLSPAGASLVHPHVQVLITRNPSCYIKKVIARCKLHKKKFGLRYFEDLVKTERKLKVRYIAKLGSTHWITSFAPTLNHEVIGVLRESCITELSKNHIKDLAEGISRVLKAYHKLGIVSVNMSIFSAPIEGLDSFNCFVRIASRNPHVFNVADRGFMEEFHEEPVISTLPEDFTPFVRKFFQ